jgi:hypothetical protein
MAASQRLFIATHWLLKLAQLFCLLGLAIMGIALGALFVAWTNLDGNHLGIPALLDDGVRRNEALAIGGSALAGILASFAVILFIVRAIIAVVDSAVSGNPFVTDNARRLTRVGTLLAVLIAVEQATSMTVNGMMEKLADAHHVPVSFMGNFDFKPDISPIGLFTILLVFVLAQIFRRGSEMRAELEGTV